MRIESLYPYIVPLTFLAIWALTSLFSRDAPPLPPRVGRPPGSQGIAPVVARSRPRPVDEVVVIEADKRRASSSTVARPPVTNARRVAKPRANTSAGLTNVEASSRALTDHVDGSTASTVGSSRRLTPLSLPPSPLNAPSTLAGTTTELIAPGTLDVHPLSADKAWELLRSPQRLREALVMSEILRPPRGMRRGPFSKR